MAKRGRSSTYTKEIADEICERLGNGEPMAQICRSIGMPDRSTVHRWGEADEQFAQRIAHARDDGFDAIAVKGLQIVDDTDEDPASRRVRADYRLKLLAKWDPKRYGDKLDLTSAGEKIGLSEAMLAAEKRLKNG